ncbi:MAG: AFG1-like ATPase [Namikivirus ohi]|uniref:AFG1-like ATPase n=1 Tax=Bacteriophage sp. TaxID=38018 RepID=A0ABY5T2E1_9VIRU|nr:MAG: AFG1-like ATPase [Bacteriophage sp.]
METSLIETMTRKASQNNHYEEGDYLNEDGLLTCGKCHTPKQCRFIATWDGKEKKPYTLCDCARARRDAEDQARQAQNLRIEVNRLRKLGFPDSEMADWTFYHDDGTDPKTTSIAHKYVDNFPEMKKRGKGLLLYGPVGTGKTHAAACIANELINQGRPCLVTNFARITNTLQGMFEGKQRYLDDFNRLDLLVIDDLAAERDTSYMNEMIFNIIDSRYRSGKPLIVTSNLTQTELTAPGSVDKERIYSRLLEMCVPVEVKGADRRERKLRDDSADMKRLLGL